MATVPFSADTERGEARCFFTMAGVMAATIVAGFSLNIALGRSSFGMPWLVHVHAAVMMGWLGLYLAQNALVFAAACRPIHPATGMPTRPLTRKNTAVAPETAPTEKPCSRVRARR